MKNQITVTGIVSSEPQIMETVDGFSILSFRLASMHVNHNPLVATWVDHDVNWYTVTASGALANNAHCSLKNGDRVVVCGKLRVHDWASANASGTQAEIEASVLGQDLNWGSSNSYCTHGQTAPTESADPALEGMRCNAVHVPAVNDHQRTDDLRGAYPRN